LLSDCVYFVSFCVSIKSFEANVEDDEHRYEISYCGLLGYKTV